MEKKMSDSLFLSLGQIIKIIAPDNGDLNDKVFMVNYIDEKEIELLEQNSLKKTVLNVAEGFLTEESIEQILILYKPENQGFARQNGLVVNRWITIEFGGELPTIINGKITNLEEDRIEIESYPDGAFLYIDFEYKGIPRDLPIQSIKDFKPPKQKKDVMAEDEVGMEQEVEGDVEKKVDEDNERELAAKDTDTGAMTQDGEFDSDVDEDDMFQDDEGVNLEDDLIDIKDIEFLDEDLGEIREEVELSEKEKIYDIKDQVDDLMDDLLSSVPSSQRTSKYLKHINVMLERYKELRQEFSTFDEQGYFSDTLYKTADYKPVAESLNNAKTVYWALPVVETKKHIYLSKGENDGENDDISIKKTSDVINNLTRINNEYKSNTIPDGQNKYDYFYKNIDFTTYDKPMQKPDMLIMETYGNNVIVENMDDFKSINIIYDEEGEVGKLTNNDRFVIDKTSVGLTKLKPLSKKRPGCSKFIPSNTERLAITQNDKLHIKGFITLPYDVMEYSSIFSDATSLLKKVNHHENQIHYGSILNDNTEVMLNDTSSPANILDNIVYHSNKTISDTPIPWKEVVDNTTLNVNELFKNLQSVIENGVSLDRISQYLTPYHIQKDGIVYNDYLLMKDYIENQIAKYKKEKISNIIKYNNYIKFIKNYAKISDLEKYIKSGEVRKLYDIDKEMDMQLLNKMYRLDDGRLMMSIIAREIHSSLDDAENDSKLTPETLNEIKQELKQRKIDNSECEPTSLDGVKLSKKYFELDDLLQDNNKNVEYDSKYDDTPYDILEGLKEERGGEITYNELVKHLTEMRAKSPEVDARSMIDGYKSVQEGDYAILEPDGYEMHYYVRKNNKWELDEEKTNKPVEEIGFCNVKQNCLKINKECMNKENQEQAVNELSAEELIKHYEEMQVKNKEEINKMISERISQSTESAQLLKILKKKHDLKYDIQKINIGKMLSAEEVMVSPHEELKNKILSDYDMVSKMANILYFINTYCRESVGDESVYWYYCSETNVPLLPTFYYDLAVGFQNGHYIDNLNEIIRLRGTADGDSIVDKHSGYMITKLQYDENEGYEKSGFKRVTRAILEEETDIVFKPKTAEVVVDKKQAELIKDVKKVLKTLDEKLKIDTKQQHDFIIKYMIIFMKKYSKKESADEKKKNKKDKKKKKIDYEKANDEIKIILMISLYVIGIQLLTPHLTRAPTFEGCVMSFDGFPLDKSGDESIVSYIACLFLKLRSSVRPYNVLPKTNRSNFNKVKDALVSTIIKFIKTKILNEPDISSKLDEKRDWMILNMSLTEEVSEFDIKTWRTFLPSLSPVNVEETRGLSGNFDKLLDESIRKGDIRQFSYIFSLMGKVINQSFLIQEDMERVVKNREVVLNTLNNIPFMENACCNETTHNFNYFSGKEPLLIERNKEIKGMMVKYNNYMKLMKPSMFYNDENTKLKYPIVSSDYDETTIYLSFIKYCKYNTGAILDDKLAAICVKNESSFKKYDSLSEKISKMKQDGNAYSMDSLIELIHIISKRNVISQGYKNDIDSPKKLFEDKLINNAGIIDKDIVSLLQKNILDSFDLVYTEDTDDGVNDFILSLKAKNMELYENISDNISATAAGRKITDFIMNMEIFKSRDGGEYLTSQDETSLFSLNYLKNTLFNVCVKYPQLILGGVTFDVEQLSKTMPKHWKLSDYHNEKLGEIIQKELGSFSRFGDDSHLNEYLKTVVEKNNTIYEFSKYIPVYSDIIGYKETKKSVFNNTITILLYKNLILKALNNYLNISNQLDEEDEEDEDIELQNQVGEIVNVILETLIYQKSTINLSMEDIQNKVLNVKEQEKTNIVEAFKNMSKEDRKSEDYMKNAKLGKWNLGQTKSLYIYNKKQYDLEIEDELAKALEQSEQQVSREQSETTQTQAVQDDEAAYENEENRIANEEQMEDMMMMGEDDDFGDMDGDEGY
tara:strand:+ start:10168 stop:15969 length:5802 start_codon:yes stop_codon:yes gene_type:complete